MKRILGVCAMIALLIGVSLSLGASSTSRVVMGQVNHYNSSGQVEGIEATIEFSTPGESVITVTTDYDGMYSTTVTPNKRYTCTATTATGSTETKILQAGSTLTTLNFGPSSQN